MQLLNFIKAIFSNLIVRKIDDSELGIVRCVIHPFHYKNAVKSQVFEPPRKSTDVSLVRLMYSSEHIAKRDGIELAKSKPATMNPNFKGLVVVNNKMLKEVNSIGMGLTAFILGTPIDDKNKYIDKEIKVFQFDKGKPYHADLIFSEPMPDGEPSTKHREYSSHLIKIVNDKQLFFEDKHPTNIRWCGPVLMMKIKDKF